MDELLVRELSLLLNFPSRKVELFFPEPTIYDLLRFNLLIKEEKYVSAVKIIIPGIDEKDFLSNPIGVIGAIKTLIYGEQKKKTGTSADEDDSGFFPSIIDMMANRYGQIPTELIKKVTFTQLLICSKGYEWNLNIQNGQEKKNLRILMDSQSGDEQLEKDLEKIKRDRAFFQRKGDFLKKTGE